MKCNLILLGLLFIGASISWAAPKPLDDLSDALELAKKENKLLFVQYGSSTCGYCKALRNMIDKGKVRLSKADYVYADLLTDNKDTIKEFDAYFKRGIPGLPFVAIIAPDGKEVGMHIGADEKPIEELQEKAKAKLMELREAQPSP